MCIVLPAPGDNPIAVNKYIIYHINLSVLKYSVDRKHGFLNLLTYLRDLKFMLLRFRILSLNVTLLYSGNDGITLQCGAVFSASPLLSIAALNQSCRWHFYRNTKNKLVVRDKTTKQGLYLV